MLVFLWLQDFKNFMLKKMPLQTTITVTKIAQNRFKLLEYFSHLIKVISYVMEYISIANLVQKFAGHMPRFAYELKAQSQFMERCSCDQLTLLGC